MRRCYWQSKTKLNIKSQDKKGRAATRATGEFEEENVFHGLYRFELSEVALFDPRISRHYENAVIKLKKQKEE